jgi:oligoribonuclease (3'-5' exoribonuclease)
MHRNRLLFLDTEFTGLDKDQDHLVQVAWVMTDLEGNILTNKRLPILKRNG